MHSQRRSSLNKVKENGIQLINQKNVLSKNKINTKTPKANKKAFLGSTNCEKTCVGFIIKKKRSQKNPPKLLKTFSKVFFVFFFGLTISKPHLNVAQFWIQPTLSPSPLDKLAIMHHISQAFNLDCN